MARAPREPKGHLKRWERGGAERVPVILERWTRSRFLATAAVLLALAGAATWLWRPAAVLLALVAVVVAIGLADILQTRRTILRNFPIIGHLRYLAESVRPELRQYFVESDTDGTPFSREKRSVVYQRAKDVVDTQAFGTRHSVYDVGYEWISHSFAPTSPDPDTARILIGKRRCARPYLASIFNISAMSYGSLSSRAVLALNEGARLGGFFHNTGEGGISPYHLRPGGDLVWQIGTGYFGCRTEDGHFDPGLFRERAALDSVKMIELKLSQGAKPAHGGILPADKVTPEIARIRGVPLGRDVVSPPAHTAFAGPLGLLEFIAELRELSGGKPVGFKLCVGHPADVLAIVKAMRASELSPDFITVDGAEGGTGAAPLEFTNSVGMPLDEGLTLVHNALRGAGIRDRVALISAGKITTGLHVLHQLALGADLCNSARAMMFAIGCIQALKCNTNECPTGVATQKPHLVKGLVVEDKAARVARYHAKTVESMLELVGASGLASPADLRPHHIYRRISSAEVRHLGEVYPPIPEGSLLEGAAPEPYQSQWDAASAEVFGPIVEEKRGNSEERRSA